MSKPDGGPAFPMMSRLTTHDKQAAHTMQFDATTVGGMSLRDWFAGQSIDGESRALVGMLSEYPQSAMEQAERLARSAYMLADAMIAERNK